MGEGAGVERQRQDCERLAEQLGWMVVETYIDNDVSAYSKKPRPEYRRMLDKIAAGGVGGVLAWHTDRLYRSIPDLTELVEVCDEHGIEIRTCRAGEVDLATPSGRLSATMFAGIARYEVERSAERIKAAKDQQALDGRFRGGPRPFGYKDGGMEIESAEANMVREAAEHVLAGGSIMSIRKRWNAAGVTTSRGAAWTGTSVRKVLLRARNAGLVEQQGKVIGPAKWPAIFDVDTWHAVRAIVTDPARRTSTSYERAHQGAGVYRCGKCGGPMKVFKAHGNERDYRCQETPHLSHRKAALDEFVSALVVERLSRPDVAEVFAVDSAETDTWKLQVERDGLQARKDELAGLFASGAIDGSQLSRASSDLQRQIDAFDMRLAAVRETSPVASLILADDVAARWAELSADTRAKVIDALMTVTVLPVGPGRRRVVVGDRVQIEWKK
ncbi:recombinase family protein [Gordonia sp. NB41Y]|uniref:recombinase family protein n=1 Tax=Gordonia sp. NB41Y TaxID=875808 RepID=UPI0021C7C7EC|nr:recombinase family protein [Gordonia sp. NB41Y]WLP89452.1 recombinase family protein [Gordonia sp. NB41Y]